MPESVEREALETYDRFVALRNKIDAGETSWSELADFFTEDAVYIDPAWGRVEGREAIREFLVQSMAGLTGYGWSTPKNWTMADGHRLISQWDQILGYKENGTPWMVPGLSILYYAGDGRFCYSHDMLNMTHIGQTMKAMGWKSPTEAKLPPRRPNRDVSLPRAWAHLEKSRAG